MNTPIPAVSSSAPFISPSVDDLPKPKKLTVWYLGGLRLHLEPLVAVNIKANAPVHRSPFIILWAIKVMGKLWQFPSL